MLNKSIALRICLLVAQCLIVDIHARDSDKDDRGKESRDRGDRGQDRRQDRGQDRRQDRGRERDRGDRSRDRGNNDSPRDQQQRAPQRQVNEAPRNRPDSNRREQQQQIRQPSVDRTPSQANFRDRQSRDDFQRRSTQGNVRQNDPSSWQRKNDFENRRRSGEDRRSKESRIRNQVQHFIKDNPKLYGKEYWDSKTSRPWRDDKNPNVTQRSYDDVGKGVRSSVSSRYGDRKKWFRNDFWRHHGIHPRYYRDNLNWWGGASPATIGTWIGLGATPYYYTGYADYGDSNAYWNSSAANTYVPSEAYYPSNVDTDQNTQSENDFWMPLGVFTIIADGQNESMSHLFLQLALGRDGTISGVLYDANLDKTYEVAGAVDKITQKAIWKISSGQHSPIIEAGIYNLTQEEIPVKIYVPGGSKQDRLLIRLEE